MEHNCEVVLAAEGVEREVEISLSYVDEDEMHELNHEWRGIDRTTDVLSFECDSAFDDDIPADETLELGDIILAPQVIARQAPGFGNSPADECRLMLVHGMLHLLGYDHIEDDEAEVMEAREDAILRDLALERGEEVERMLQPEVADYIRRKGLWTPEGRMRRLSERIEAEPDNAALRIERGKLHYGRAAWGDALNDFNRALEIDAGNCEARQYVEMVQEILAFRYKDIYNP